MRIYRWRSRIGNFYIRPSGRYWAAMFEDEPLGEYRSPQGALDDLAGGHADWPSGGVDPSTLGMPDEIGDWDVIESR
tara:strand:+ start:2030 stop:2260 length:231 start_codon:yes stop_codon:yes gene_type:complete